MRCGAANGLDSAVAAGSGGATDPPGSPLPMTEDLAPSRRPTARGLPFRRRSRIVPGPLRPAQMRAGSGVAAGMLTGALLGLAFLAAFTLPFVRVGGSAGGAEPRPARAAVRTSAAQADRAQEDRAQEAGMAAAGLAAAERAADHGVPDAPAGERPN